MKIGVNLKIDVTKLDKTKFFKAKTGAVYADLTVFIDPNQEDQYGYHGGITQALTKDERDAKVKPNYLGNAKVFWKDSSQGDVTPNTQEITQEHSPQGESFDLDIPF